MTAKFFIVYSELASEFGTADMRYHAQRRRSLKGLADTAYMGGIFHKLFLIQLFQNVQAWRFAAKEFDM